MPNWNDSRPNSTCANTTRTNLAILCWFRARLTSWQRINQDVGYRCQTLEQSFISGFEPPDLLVPNRSFETLSRFGGVEYGTKTAYLQTAQSNLTLAYPTTPFSGTPDRRNLLGAS